VLAALVAALWVRTPTTVGALTSKSMLLVRPTLNVGFGARSVLMLIGPVD
jgi:hypothetical protein